MKMGSDEEGGILGFASERDREPQCSIYKAQIYKTATEGCHSYSHPSLSLAVYGSHVNLAFVNQQLKYNQPRDPNSNLRTEDSSRLEQVLIRVQTHAHTHKQDKEQLTPSFLY